MAKRIFITATNTDIGKTYVTSHLLKHYASLGFKVGVIKPIETGVVDAGGDVGFAGTPPGADGWRVGIQHPRQDGLLGVALLDGGGIATSGDYQRYAVVDSIRYHHILDPATGYPSRGVMSVTVATERAVDADALATAVFVLGPDEGLALIERTPGAEAVLVTGDADSVGRVLVSSGLKEKFVEQ